MADNIIVSYDDEKRINDLLDQGIDELKKSSCFIKSNTFSKSVNSNSDNNSKNENYINKNNNNQTYNFSVGSNNLDYNKPKDLVNFNVYEIPKKEISVDNYGKSKRFTIFPV